MFGYDCLFGAQPPSWDSISVQIEQSSRKGMKKEKDSNPFLSPAESTADTCRSF